MLWTGIFVPQCSFNLLSFWLSVLRAQLPVLLDVQACLSCFIKEVSLPLKRAFLDLIQIWIQICFHCPLLLKIYFVHMNVLPSCMYMYHMCAWCPRRLEQGIGSQISWNKMTVRYQVSVSNKAWVLCKSDKWSSLLSSLPSPTPLLWQSIKVFWFGGIMFPWYNLFSEPHCRVHSRLPALSKLLELSWGNIAGNSWQR